MGLRRKRAHRARPPALSPPPATERARGKPAAGGRKRGSGSLLRRLVYWSLVLGLWALIAAIGVIAFAVSGGVAQQWIPHPVSRVNLGLLLETWPGGMRYRPSTVTQIAFGPDPAEDYVESGLPVRLCQATFALRDGWKFPLVVTAEDAARLREWAIEKGIVVSDPDGYANVRGRKEPKSSSE